MRIEKETTKIEQRDTAAITTMIERYYPEILRYCKWHAPGSEMAEDAAQEVFLKAVRFLGRDGFHGNFRAFLYQIARNTCLDMKKNRWNYVCCLDDINDEPHDSGIFVDRVEVKRDLESALSGLDDMERELIQLRFGQDLKLREIAEVLDLPLRTVQSKLRKALKQMKSELEV